MKHPARTDGGGDGRSLLRRLRTPGLATLLAVGLAVVLVVGAVAGAVVVLTGDKKADLGPVPAGVDSVSYTDVDAVRNDEAIGRVVDHLLGLAANESDAAHVPEDYDALLDRVENETGLPMEDLHAAVGFSKQMEAEGNGVAAYSATIIRTDWPESDFVAAYENQSFRSFEADEYAGTTVYVPESEPFGTPQWIAVLGDGTYVVGTEGAVKDAIDVHAGDADALDGELREVFEGTRSGYVRFASRLPVEQIPNESIDAGPSSVDPSAFRSVRYVSGSYFTDANTLGLEVRFHANDSAAAKDVQDLTDGLVSLSRGLAQDETVEETLRDVEVTRDGAVVTVTYANTVTDVNAVLDALYERAEDEAGHETAQAPKLQAGAAVMVDADADEVTVTWTSNANAEALDVEVEVVSGHGAGDAATLHSVGEAYTYEGEDGTTVMVTVYATADGHRAVILQREAEL